MSERYNHTTKIIPSSVPSVRKKALISTSMEIVRFSKVLVDKKYFSNVVKHSFYYPPRLVILFSFKKTELIHLFVPNGDKAPG